MGWKVSFTKGPRSGNRVDLMLLRYSRSRESQDKKRRRAILLVAASLDRPNEGRGSQLPIGRRIIDQQFRQDLWNMGVKGPAE